MRSDCPWVIREDDRSILRFRIVTFPPDIPGDCGRRNREPLLKCCHPVPNQLTVPAPSFSVGLLLRELLAQACTMSTNCGCPCCRAMLPIRKHSISTRIV